MTQEEKQLLLQDLSARLPYGVVVELDEKFGFNKGTHTLVKELLDSYCLESIKPYLRSMSSMTEEEKDELSHLLPKDWSIDIDKFNNFYFNICPSIFIEIDIFLHIIGWLNKHHFDYRGLIEKGLAIEVTENNNPYKK